MVDLINRYPKDQLPEALWKYVDNREGYDYHHHAEVGSDNARFVSDEITEAFAVVGPASAHRERLEELREVGVTQFNIYLMNGDEEDCLDAYGRTGWVGTIAFDVRFTSTVKGDRSSL